jgi:hypothetical protein
MISKPKSFASVLAGVQSSSEGQMLPATRPRRPNVAFVGPEAEAQGRQAPPPALDSLYREPADGEPQQATGLPAFRPVDQELGLMPGMAPADLQRIRREFALANHPDRVAPALRDQATERMTIANMLVDQALQRAKGSAR